MEFKALQAKWYQKLKEAGFEDIEKDGHLKAHHSVYFIVRYTPITFENKRKYYEKAQEFLHTYCFNPQEELVWKLHIEGFSMREISKNTRIKTCQVFLIISKLKKKMIGELIKK